MDGKESSNKRAGIVGSFKKAAGTSKQNAMKTGKIDRRCNEYGELRFSGSGRFFAFLDKRPRDKQGMGSLSQEVCLAVARETQTFGFMEYDGEYYVVHHNDTADILDDRLIAGNPGRHGEAQFRKLFPECFKP